MTASLRILCRMFGAFYSRWSLFNLFVLGSVGLFFIGWIEIVRHSMANFRFLGLAILAPFLFAASKQYGQDREAGRMRALLALPIPPRTLATWFWLTGCIGLAEIAEAAAFALRRLGPDPAARGLVPDAIGQPGIFIALASIIFLGMLASHVLSSAARRDDWPWLESLGAPVCVLGAVAVCLWAATRPIPSAAAGLGLAAAAAGLAAIGWLASPILLPSHSFLDPRRPSRPSRKFSAQDGAQAGGYRIAPLEWTAPLRKNAIWGAIFAVAFSPALWFFAVRRFHPLSSRDGLLTSGMMAPALVIWFVIVVFVSASYRILAVRSLRALPWRRVDMTAYLAAIPLAAIGGAFAASAVIALVCAAFGLEDPLRGLAPRGVLLAGACLATLPLTGAYGIRGGLAAVWIGLFFSGMGSAFSSVNGLWLGAAGLLIGGLSLWRFHAQLGGTDIYRRPAEAGNRRM